MKAILKATIVLLDDDDKPLELYTCETKSLWNVPDGYPTKGFWFEIKSGVGEGNVGLNFKVKYATLILDIYDDETPYMEISFKKRYLEPGNHLYLKAFQDDPAWSVTKH